MSKKESLSQYAARITHEAIDKRHAEYEERRKKIMNAYGNAIIKEAQTQKSQYELKGEIYYDHPSYSGASPVRYVLSDEEREDVMRWLKSEGFTIEEVDLRFIVKW